MTPADLERLAARELCDLLDQEGGRGGYIVNRFRAIVGGAREGGEDE